MLLPDPGAALCRRRADHARRHAAAACEWRALSAPAECRRHHRAHQGAASTVRAHRGRPRRLLLLAAHHEDVHVDLVAAAGLGRPPHDAHGQGGRAARDDRPVGTRGHGGLGRGGDADGVARARADHAGFDRAGHLVADQPDPRVARQLLPRLPYVHVPHARRRVPVPVDAEESAQVGAGARGREVPVRADIPLAPHRWHQRHDLLLPARARVLHICADDILAQLHPGDRLDHRRAAADAAVPRRARLPRLPDGAHPADDRAAPDREHALPRADGAHDAAPPRHHPRRHVHVRHGVVHTGDDPVGTHPRRIQVLLWRD
mmetsp:Transcript_13493/g.35124  ORF Transcript_13493/g.35124 Transcript_13493/m.35124 type:complete len:318 (-) Transcript_13493:425-1378(-)